MLVYHLNVKKTFDMIIEIFKEIRKIIYDIIILYYILIGIFG